MEDLQAAKHFEFPISCLDRNIYVSDLQTLHLVQFSQQSSFNE